MFINIERGLKDFPNRRLRDIFTLAINMSISKIVTIIVIDFNVYTISSSNLILIIIIYEWWQIKIYINKLMFIILKLKNTT